MNRPSRVAIFRPSVRLSICLPRPSVRLSICLSVAACAKMAPPPGGPPDTVKPQLIATRPESVGVYPDFKGDVVFQFSEIVSEGSSPSMGFGTGDLERLFLLSPTSRFPVVKWKRDRITIHPREGWKPNRAYRIELLPGVTDLRRNRSDTSVVVSFSTGGDPPTDTLSGLVIDWVGQKLAKGTLVEMVLEPDSLVYRALTDSSGRFRVGPLPHGEYLIYGVVELNKNFQRDAREPFDSVRIAAGTVDVPTLWTFPHDTVGPRFASITVNDSLSATVAFTQPLDPYQRLDSLTYSLRLLPDSTPVAVHSLLPKTMDDSLQAALRAAADSAKARDSAAVAHDTLKVRPDSGAKKLPVPAVPSFGRVPRPNTDTTQALEKKLLAERPTLIDRLVLRTDSALVPDKKYVLRIEQIRNVNHVASDPMAPFSVPKKQPVDTSKKAVVDSLKVPAPADSVVKPDFSKPPIKPRT